MRFPTYTSGLDLDARGAPLLPAETQAEAGRVSCLPLAVRRRLLARRLALEASASHSPALTPPAYPGAPLLPSGRRHAPVCLLGGRVVPRVVVEMARDALRVLLAA